MQGKRIVGIDIGKRWLDMARGGAIERHGNTASAIADLVASLDGRRDVVLFERCGGYERALEAALAEAGIGWSLVHPLRLKAFRTAQGVKAKTDALDARLIKAFGEDRLAAGKLRLGRIEDVGFAALMARKRQLLAFLHAERCRKDSAATPEVAASVERLAAHLEAELAAIEATLCAHEHAAPELQAKQKAMCAQTGVAITTARALLSELPELGRLDAKEITALAGLAPRVHKSGRRERRRGLAPGRPAVKTILFNPARSAMRFDPDIKAFSERLRQRGKPGLVILVAVMRKLLVRLNARLRDLLAAQPMPGPAPAQ